MLATSPTRPEPGCPACGGVHLLKMVQPSTVYGSPEDLIDRGVTDAVAVTGRWADDVLRLVTGLDNGGAIQRVLQAAIGDELLDDFAGALSDELEQGIMLGALDSSFEAENDDTIDPPEFEAPASVEQAAQRDPIVLLRKGTEPGFSTHPLDAALDIFRAKKPLTSAVFEALSGKAKLKAFTVARMQRLGMIRTVQRELARQVRRGADLREFRKFAEARLISAGWTPANASHVETIFRTNVVQAYNAGRVEHAMRPSVLRLRPFWQVVTVNDGPPRQRPAHRALHLRVLRATDAAWGRAYPPFGFMCRCRVRTVAATYEGPVELELPGVPDDGFSSGVPQLLAA